MVIIKPYKSIPYIFPVGEECMVSFLAAKRLEKQLLHFYPRQHLTYVFEFRIMDGEMQVDLAIAINQKEDLQFFKAYFTSISNHNQVKTWLEDCFKLREKEHIVKSFWIEIDLDGHEQSQLPSLFISLKQQRATFKDLQHFVDILSFHTINKRNNELLKNCHDALKGKQYIEHIGVMHSRKGAKTTRMYIRGFDTSSLLIFLKTIHWKGEEEPLKKLLKEIQTPIIEYMSIAIEFNNIWLPTIGIEFHLKKGNENSVAFISKLKTAGFCSKKRAKAMEDILKEKKVKADKIAYRRHLSHFKLTLGKGEKIEPKVYFQLIPSYTNILGF